MTEKKTLSIRMPVETIGRMKDIKEWQDLNLSLSQIIRCLIKIGLTQIEKK